MGVNGLWSLITPVARPIALESLANTRLAIDSSIWLYQFQLAMRDRKTGDALAGAHILGFMRRITKLLYFGIKPVFVFDGDAPALKKRTIAERKKRKSGAGVNVAKTAAKLLAAQLRAAALEQATRREAKENVVAAGPMDTGEQIDPDATYLDDLLPAPGALHRSPKKALNPLNFFPPPPPPVPPKKFVAKDQYHLPTLASTSLTARASPTDSRVATEDDLKLFIQEMRPEDFDIDSKVFNELPVEVRYEIIGDLRLLSRQGGGHRGRRGTRYTDRSLASGKDAEQLERERNMEDLDFSKNQIRNLMQRNILTQKLFEVTDQLGQGKQEPGSSSSHPSTSTNSHSSRLVNLSTAAAAKTASGGGGGSRATRIAGEKNREYILVKQGKELGGGWILGSQNPVLGSGKTVVLGGSSEDESIGSEGEEFDEVVVADSRYGTQRLLSPPAATAPTRRNQAINALRARYAPQPTLPILDPYLDAPSSHSTNRVIRTSSAGVVDDLFGETEIDEEMRNGEGEVMGDEEEMIQRALLEDARMGNLAFAAADQVGERDLGIGSSGSRSVSAPRIDGPIQPAPLVDDDDELEYIDDEDFYHPASASPVPLNNPPDELEMEEGGMTMSTRAERDQPRIQGVPYSEINPFKPAPIIPYIPKAPETIDTHGGFVLTSPRKGKAATKEEAEDSDEFEEVEIARTKKSASPNRLLSPPPPARPAPIPAPAFHDSRLVFPPVPPNKDPPPRSELTKNRQRVEETTSHASFMDRILPPESDEEEEEEFEPVGVPIRSLVSKQGLAVGTGMGERKGVEEVLLSDSDDEEMEMEEVVVQPREAIRTEDITFPLPNPFAPTAVVPAATAAVDERKGSATAIEDEEDLYDEPIIGNLAIPSPPVLAAPPALPSPPIPVLSPPPRSLTPPAQLSNPSPAKSQQVSLQDFGSTSSLPHSHHSVDASEEEEESEMEVEVVEMVDLKGKGRAITPEAVLSPPRTIIQSRVVQEDVDEEEEEEFVDWEKSPTPPPRLDPSSTSAAAAQAAEEAESLALLEAAEAAEELENERNFQREEDQYADMLSNLRNRKLDEMRNEARNDIAQLREQVNNEKRGADGVTRQMATDIKEMLILFGIPYIDAPQEAEAECASLLSRSLVDGIVTDDSDVFLFGGSRIYRNMFNQTKYVECYLLSDLERELGLTRRKLVDLAFLLGSDYVDGLVGVGPVRARELLEEFADEEGGLKGFAEWWRKVQRGIDTKVDNNSAFKRAFKKKYKNLFIEDSWPNPAISRAYYEPNVNDGDEQFSWSGPDLDGLRAYLQSNLSWNNDKVNEILLPLIKRQNERKAGTIKIQATLGDYFDVSAGIGPLAPRKKPVGYSSGRLQNVVQNWRKNEKRKVGEIVSESETDVSASDADIPAPPKKKRAPRKAKVAPIVVADPIEIDELDDVEDVPPPVEKQKRAPVVAKGKGKATATAKAAPAKRGPPKKTTAASRRREHRLRVEAGESSDDEMVAGTAKGGSGVSLPKPRAKRIGKKSLVVESEEE